MVLHTFFRTFNPVEAQEVTQVTSPGKSMQGIRFSDRLKLVIYVDTEKKTIHLFDPLRLEDYVLQLGKVCGVQLS